MNGLSAKPLATSGLRKASPSSTSLPPLNGKEGRAINIDDEGTKSKSFVKTNVTADSELDSDLTSEGESSLSGADTDNDLDSEDEADTSHGFRTADTTSTSYNSGNSDASDKKGKKRALLAGGAVGSKPVSKTPKNAKAATGEAKKRSDGTKTGKRQNNQKGFTGKDEQFCHQHGKSSLCKFPLIQCTVVRGGGNRCAYSYCSYSLENFYNEELEQIRKNGRGDTTYDPADHVGPGEAKYFWICPRCRGACYCSGCRRFNGLPAFSTTEQAAKVTEEKGSLKAHLAASRDMMNGGVRTKSSSPSKSDKKASSKKVASSASVSSSPIAGAKLNGHADPKSPGKLKKQLLRPALEKDRSNRKKLTKKNIESKKQTTGDANLAKNKSKPTANKSTTSKASAPASTAKAKTKSGQKLRRGASPKSMKRQTLFPRKLVEPKKVDAPQLDVIHTKLPSENIAARIWLYETLVRFDAVETPANVLKTLDKFESWTPRSVQTIFERMICTIAGLGKNIQSGQPRAGFQSLVKSFRDFGGDNSRGEPWKVACQLLQDHEITITPLPVVEHEFSIEDIEEPAPPSPTLFTRMTRARRAAVENREVKRMNLREASVSSWESEGESEYDYQDVQDQEDGEEGSKFKATKIKLTLRRKGRWSASAENAEDEIQPRRSSRTQRLQEESDEEDASVRETSNGDREGDDALSAASGRNSAESESPSEKHEAKKEKTKTPEPAGPIPAPNLEDKISILVALIELVLQAPEVNKDLRQCADEIMAVEKEAKAALGLLEKEYAEINSAVQKKAPSMLNRELFEAWKKEKRMADRNHKWALLNHRVQLYNNLNTLKLRTGPLGVDVDGREYWQLSEYVEQMPRQTTGRWAWGIVVHGKPFPSPAAMAAAAEEVRRKEEEAQEEARAEKAAAEAAVEHTTDRDVVMGDDRSNGTSSPSGNGALPSDNVVAPKQVPVDPEEAKFQVRGSASAPSTRLRTMVAKLDVAAAPDPRPNCIDLTPPTPSASQRSILQADETESELSELSETESVRSVPSSSGKEEQWVAEQPDCWQTVNWPYWINQTILYIKYRLEKVEYDGNKAQSEGKGPTKTKMQIAAEQQKRREQIETLCKNLEQVLEYFMWHFELVTKEDIQGDNASPQKPAKQA
ncbi:hypothetical protein K437DRAFT_253239 [Tilletiaria anomala UBC 951]|uniref:Zinc-finger domain-containing protein n=1 Tax=Tilletiaria anomala (strain ATCC 24038 / CBS 436.72 / UBC 951) TaxID=1037660 RepID=A0A066WQD7_TILAU|nr:uncharacterized protein K437DRAFT_253239 [Tilletiaria anomala UBC 951]KDN53224.1 hypothetical protein K437DRAFT_253239 [Tilletiaria anomala UBC 951]